VRRNSRKREKREKRGIFDSSIIVMLAALSLVLAACGSSSSGGGSAKSPIVVCGDLALSGVYAQIGETDNWGATAFFKHINATGGLLGRPVKYKVVNNQSNPAQAALIAKKCILEDHAKFIVGPESGATTSAALPIAIAYKTILISLSSGWQTNGYPKNQLNSWGFPGFYDVFYEDNVAAVEKLIVPRHYTRVALIQDNCGPVCLANKPAVTQLASQHGFQLVSTQTVEPGATNVTPQVLALLAAKPQIILLGLVPGTDSITAIRAIRAQAPDIPIATCSACELPSFIAAVGGPKVMHNVYVLGSMQGWLKAAEQGATPAEKATAAGLREYFAGLRAAGFTSENQLDNSQEGWDAGLEIAWAVKTAGTVDDEEKVMRQLQRLNINTLGIEWDRTESDYLKIKKVHAAMEIIKPDGGTALYLGDGG
jgi:ABC-type branched-subunit amino acid transport system substrate-binding protein